MQALFNDKTLAALNGARRALRTIAQRAYMEHDTQASGRVAEAASIAQDAIFTVLNVAQSYGGVLLDRTDIHLSEADEPAAGDEPADTVADSELRTVGEAAAPRDELEYHEHTDSILLGYTLGSAETEHGKLTLTGSGKLVRFALDGRDGYVELDLTPFAESALAWLVMYGAERQA